MAKLERGCQPQIIRQEMARSCFGIANCGLNFSKAKIAKIPHVHNRTFTWYNHPVGSLYIAWQHLLNYIAQDQSSTREDGTSSSEPCIEKAGLSLNICVSSGEVGVSVSGA